MCGERADPESVDLPVAHLVLHPGPDHHAVAAVGASRTGRGSRAAPRSPRPGSIGPTSAASASIACRAVHRERAEEVLLVGEVQVERAVRRAGRAHDVVDPALVVAPLGEHAHAGVGEPPHRLAALRAQLAAGVPGVPAGRARLRTRSCAILTPCSPRRARGGPPLRRCYRLRHRGGPADLVHRGRSRAPTRSPPACPTRRRRRRRRRARPAARARVPLRLSRRGEGRRDHRGRQRPAPRGASATVVLERAAPRLVVAAAGLEPNASTRRSWSST